MQIKLTTSIGMLMLCLLIFLQVLGWFGLWAAPAILLAIVGLLAVIFLLIGR